MNRLLKVSATAAMALLIAACGTAQKDGGMGDGGDVVGDGNGGAQAGGAMGDGGVEGREGAAASGAAGDGAVEGEDMGARDPLEVESGPLSERIIYFEFDSSTIQPEFSSVLQAHGEYLATHPEVSVTVEGHTDERGSREYNLALGERRARAVKQVLTLNGAAGDQVATVSFGEEQPAASGHDEAAWAENRRAELVYSR